MSDIKRHKERYNELDQLGKGGQAQTFKVQDSSTKQIAALKLLLSQKDTERRARMRREVVNLETLNHPNIPKVWDSNTEFYKNLDYKLFVVLEYIDGPTLSDFNISSLSLVDKITMLKKLAEVVNYSHSLGIVHRDINPDNLMLRNSRFDDPILIDFGLSFNSDDADDDFKTPNGQHLGNRFMILPEQKVGEAGKRDFRTDVTCLVGLFYFLLVNEVPTILEDQQEQKPHQRANAKMIIANLPEHQRNLINGLFDVGFNQLIDKRWQTAKSLVEYFDTILSATPFSEGGTDDYITFVKAFTSQPAYVEKLNSGKIITAANSYISNVLVELTRELGEGWGSSFPIQGGNKYRSEGYGTVHYITNGQIPISLSTYTKTFMTGNELVVLSLVELSSSEVSRKEVFRQPVTEQINFGSLNEALKRHYSEMIAKEIRTK